MRRVLDEKHMCAAPNVLCFLSAARERSLSAKRHCKQGARVPEAVYVHTHSCMLWNKAGFLQPCSGASYPGGKLLSPVVHKECSFLGGWEEV